MIDERGNGLEHIRVAVSARVRLVLAAPDVVEVPLEITEDDEVELAIVVEIDPGSAAGPTAALDAGFVRDIGEVPFPLL